MSAHLYLIQTEDLEGNLLPGVVMQATSPTVGPWDATINACGQKEVTLEAADYSVDFFLNGQKIGHRDWTLADPPIYPIRVGLDTGFPVWTDAQLRAIKGAIWPTRGSVQFGPRPGQVDNIIDTGCEAYTAGDLELARTTIRSRGYTHVQMGPFIDGGYHGQYPPVDFRLNADATLVQIEAWWKAGFAVVAFIGPDGWTTQQMESLEPIFLQPRWQAALKLIVPMGWEPGKDTPNAEFVKRYQWAKRVFPNALQYIHLCADFDAPGNDADLTPNQSHYIGMAECWNRVVPYLTGYLIQNGPYNGFPHDDPTLLQNFTDQFRVTVRGSLRDRFVNGYAGWPTTCANGGHLDLIAAEETSYYAYWSNLPEAASRQWGQAALAASADGAFDGC